MRPFSGKGLPPLGPPPLTARERALAQWHGANLAPAEVAHAMRARSAADVLPRVLAELRLDQRRVEAEIVKVWKDLLDPNLVAHAQPAGLHRGTLFVVVDSSVWLSEIVRYHRREILERLQHAFGREMIKRISFRAG